MITRTAESPVYRAKLSDSQGAPNFVVAGPDENQVWLYVHDLTPTVLRLHRPVVRFLRAALTELTTWFCQPLGQQAPLVWTLPRTDDYPECVLIASRRRAWMHVFATQPSVVRITPTTVSFLLDEGLAGLPTWRDDPEQSRWSEVPDAPSRIDEPELTGPGLR